MVDIYKVVSTKCPVLNIEFRNQQLLEGNSPELEVLVKLHDSEPVGVICTEYMGQKKCEVKSKLQPGHCIYADGWKKLE
ncbi:hypothetical protein CL621_02455 [archaeon]|nr:hypothetical protein [archaeon]|tara:strand:+ start:59 stop:295 length:237 start_codon:yes stop_codon:yes gene_type:complete